MNNNSFDTTTSLNLNQESFYNGLYCFYKDDLVKAKSYLTETLNTTDEMESLYWRCMSYLGLVEVFMNGTNGGLYRCYDARTELNEHLEMYLNIAYAEYRLGNQKRCIKVLSQCLQLEPKNKLAHNLIECIKKQKRTNPLKSLFLKLFKKSEKNACLDSSQSQIKNYLSSMLGRYVEQINFQNN